MIVYAGKLKKEFNEKPIKVKLRWAYLFLSRKGFSIRWISHQGQILPKESKKLKLNFIEDIIKKRKGLNIEYDENECIISMDETPCLLDMSFITTIDFFWQKNIEYITEGRECYRISIILSITGDGFKLPPLVIIKGKLGKTIKKNLRKLNYVTNKEMYIYCQPQGWCTSEIFSFWLNDIFIPYEKSIGQKCLLILDKASSHISYYALEILKKMK